MHVLFGGMAIGSLIAGFCNFVGKGEDWDTNSVFSLACAVVLALLSIATK